MTFPVGVRILQVVTFWINAFGLALALTADTISVAIVTARIICTLMFGCVTVFNIVELYDNRQNS